MYLVFCIGYLYMLLTKLIFFSFFCGFGFGVFFKAYALSVEGVS